METAAKQVIIDTDVLVDLLRGLEKAIAFIAELEQKRLILSTTVINAYELYYGACKSAKKMQNLAAAQKLLERLVVINMSLKSAEKVGEIQAELEAKDQFIGVRDVMIGSIALTKGYPLITRNTGHMQKIKGLSLITAP